MKKLLIFCVGILYTPLLNADPVTIITAAEVAENFCKANIPQTSLKSTHRIDLVYQCTPSNNTGLKSTQTNALYYVFIIFTSITDLKTANGQG